MGDDRRIRLCGPEFPPYRHVVAGKFRVQHDGERNLQLLEQPADARDAPVDPVLTERLVHEVRIAGREVRAEHRALAEAELLDEQSEADCDLSTGRPGGDMDGVAGKSRDRIDSGIWPGGTGSGIDSALGPACGRKLTGEAERHCGDEAGVAGRPLRDPDRGAEIHGRSARLLAPGPGVIKVGH